MYFSHISVPLPLFLLSFPSLKKKNVSGILGLYPADSNSSTTIPVAATTKVSRDCQVSHRDGGRKQNQARLQTTDLDRMAVHSSVDTGVYTLCILCVFV